MRHCMQHSPICTTIHICLLAIIDGSTIPNILLYKSANYVYIIVNYRSRFFNCPFNPNIRKSKLYSAAGLVGACVSSIVCRILVLKQMGWELNYTFKEVDPFITRAKAGPPSYNFNITFTMMGTNTKIIKTSRYSECQAMYSDE